MTLSLLGNQFDYSPYHDGRVELGNRSAVADRDGTGVGGGCNMQATALPGLTAEPIGINPIVFKISHCSCKVSEVRDEGHQRAGNSCCTAP